MYIHPCAPYDSRNCCSPDIQRRERRLGCALGRQIAGSRPARPEPMGVAITIAVLCLWQPQPRPPRAASRRRAPTPLLCTDASSDWRRRDLLRAAAVSALTAGGLSVGPAFAAPPPAETVPQIEALVWRPAGGAAAKAGSARCSGASVRTAFGPKFINYLARFLLSYDVPSRRLWRARAAEIPLAWNKKQAADANPNPNPKP